MAVDHDSLPAPLGSSRVEGDLSATLTREQGFDVAQCTDRGAAAAGTNELAGRLDLGCHGTCRNDAGEYELVPVDSESWVESAGISFDELGKD